MCIRDRLKVYLNDELMGVLPVTKEQLGKKIRAQLPIDPLYITDFNRIRLEFVGHYRDVCENPASSTLWLDVGRESYLDLTYQSLKVHNDLSHFPVPVSYTHLDVYKRQGSERFRLASGSGKATRCWGSPGWRRC